MPQINETDKEIIFRIVYTGPSFSGIPSNIESVFRQISIYAQKEQSYLDFSPIELAQLGMDSIPELSVKFSLFSTPSQKYYRSGLKLLFQGVDGIIFVADAENDSFEKNLDIFRELEENLRANHLDIYSIPLVIQWNQENSSNALPLKELETHLNFLKVPTQNAIQTEEEALNTLKFCVKKVLKKFETKIEAFQNGILQQNKPMVKKGTRERLRPRPPSPLFHPISQNPSLPALPKRVLDSTEEEIPFYPPASFSFSSQQKNDREFQEIKEQIRKGNTAREIWMVIHKSIYYLEAFKQLHHAQPHEYYSSKQIGIEFLFTIVFGLSAPKKLEILPTLLAALEDKDPYLRRKASWALGQLGEEAKIAIPALTKMLREESGSLRKSASKALRRISPDNYL